MTALTKSRLTELLERVEAASGADRELDVLIWAQLAEDRDVRWDGNTLLGRARKPPHDECVLGTIDPGRVARNFQVGYSRPPYPSPTASLDAALALVDRVLPGWCKSAVDLRPEPCEGYVWERGHVGNIQGKAPTPALAVLVAMLRALGDGHASCPS
jgi:hypothetical protein